jgi:hypothetical protein
MALPINVGDSILVSFGPHMATTTATVVTVDNLRRQLTVNHVTGALAAKAGTIHMDHARQLSESFAPAVRDGKVWS